MQKAIDQSCLLCSCTCSVCHYRAEIDERSDQFVIVENCFIRRIRYVSSDSATAGVEADWQARDGQWQVRYEPAGVNITLRVAVARESNLVDG